MQAAFFPVELAVETATVLEAEAKAATVPPQLAEVGVFVAVVSVKNLLSSSWE